MRSFHDTLTIQHFVLYMKMNLKNLLLYKRNFTIFPFNFSALISKPFSMVNFDISCSETVLNQISLNFQEFCIQFVGAHTTHF